MSLIDQSYFEWLVSQITIPERNRHTFNELFLKLHHTEFFFTVSGDDNRVQDAIDLRTQFKQQVGTNIKFNNYCSILEIIVALSRTLEFVDSGKASDWAWCLIENLKLQFYYDPWDRDQNERVTEILDRFVWRRYQRNGRGGLFPLVFAKEDQRKVELWYQLNAYINENSNL